jgi:hypothetical protein
MKGALKKPIERDVFGRLAIWTMRNVPDILRRGKQHGRLSRSPELPPPAATCDGPAA